MPIDPNIVLGIKNQPIIAQDPLEQYGKGLALKGLMGQQELQGLQMQQARQGVDDENAVRDAYRNAGGDNARLRALLQGGGQYKAIQALDKFELDKREKEAGIGAHIASTKKTELDAAVVQIERGASLLQGAKDQASYDAARKQMMLYYPQVAAQWPAVYNPQEVAAKISAGMTIVQNLADARSREQQAETGRHNLASETGVTRGQDMTDTRTREGQAETARHNLATEEKERGLTESQGKAAGMAMRAQKAHDILNTLEAGGTKTPGLIKMGAETVPVIGGALGMGVNSLPSALGGPSTSQQQVDQAQRDFVNAVLRVESGASINKDEFENARKQYFPQPGDTQETRDQKRRNRETAIDSLKLQGGPGAKSVISAPPAPKKDSLGGVLSANADGSYNYGFNR